MTGGTTEHNKIAGNFYVYLHFLLRKRAENIYFGDVRLWILKYRQYTYPDVMVIALQIANLPSGRRHVLQAISLLS